MAQHQEPLALFSSYLLLCASLPSNLLPTDFQGYLVQWVHSGLLLRESAKRMCSRQQRGTLIPSTCTGKGRVSIMSNTLGKVVCHELEAVQLKVIRYSSAKAHYQGNLSM